MGFEFTESQRAAIYSRGGSVLVSAAAGSGKTRVLTERVLSYITDESDARDIDSFLIITYTRAAAAELRGRIMGLLAEKTAENPFDRRLRRQQEKCAGAGIGTIHSFCAQVLRENCQALGLSPAFAVMDEAKCSALKAAALEKVLEARYENAEDNPDFRLLSDTVGVGRDDKRLEQTVLSLHTKLMSHPYPEDWAESRASALFTSARDASETVWGRELMHDAALSAGYWLRRMESAVLEIQQAGGKLEKAYFESFSETVDSLRGFVSALEGDWDLACECSSISFPRLGALRAPEDPELAAGLKAVREGCKKAAAGWAQTFHDNSERSLADVRAMAPAMRELLKLTLDMERAYSAEKRRRDELDFSDLEHLTLRLLVDKDSGKPTETAKRLSERYTEIMVDEYQDVNAVQEMIFRAVSKNGSNLFMVGDVKQSIYRFRLADPTIFMEKYRAFSEKSADGRLILLRENFRSRKCILDAANSVFSTIMSERLGELEYDERASLAFGAKGYPENTDCPVELRFIDTDLNGGEDSPEGVRAEALYIANRINEMMSRGEPVYENGRARSCRWGDFALLLHSPGVNGEEFSRTLTERGIPVSSGAGGGFFELPETALAINLLEVLDDPRADVPLISLLRSPLFGFSPDELAAIRARDKSCCFYSALVLHAEAGDERSAGFLALISRLRAISSEMPMDALLWRIYSETGIFTVCAAQSGGSQSSLMQLMECARDFASGGGFGLARFVKWLRGMAERGEGPSVSGAGEDCVKIMSIHKSKGLEFPFVFLADLSHGFNRQDIYAPVLMHSELGLGPKLTDAGRGLEYPTIARRAAASRLSREKLSEEMRVLYVAMTRAKERLVMTCVWDKAAAQLEEMAPLYSDGASPELLSGASSFAKWLAAAVLADKSGTIDARVISAGDMETEAAEAANRVEEPCEPDAAALSKIKAALSWSYPHALAVDLPTKLTATGLERAELDRAEAMTLPGVEPENAKALFRRARLGQEHISGAAERGTAVHAMLQHATLARLSEPEAIREQARALVEMGRLTPEQAQALDEKMLLRFGRGELCRRMLNASEMRREFRFTLLADAGGFFDVPEGETVLLQGVVDCFIVEHGEITVIDYKTDRVSDNAQDYAERYFPQLRAYASALERICGLPVREALLYFLRTGQTVSVPLGEK